MDGFSLNFGLLASGRHPMRVFSKMSDRATSVNLPPVLFVDQRTFQRAAGEAAGELTVTLHSATAGIAEEAFMADDQELDRRHIDRISCASFESSINTCPSVAELTAFIRQVTDYEPNLTRYIYEVTSAQLQRRIVGARAFQGQECLQKVVLPESILRIGRAAFSGTGLRQISLPHTITHIESNAFEWCTRLTTLDLPNDLITIQPRAFVRCQALTTVTLPNNLRYIGDRAFDHCVRLTTINFPSTLRYIGDFAFLGTGLKSAELPESLEHLGNGAFMQSKIRKATLPVSISQIPVQLFDDCERLTSVTTSDVLDRVGSYAFFGCKRLTKFELPDSVTRVDSGAFEGCVLLKPTFELPARLLSIGRHTFDGCTGLQRVSIPATVTSVGVNAFRGCSRLASVTIENPETLFAASSFAECTRLKEFITASDAVEDESNSSIPRMVSGTKRLLLETRGSRRSCQHHA
eukprot:m.467524 g.467524  ORF g.467524 m.467524 type:complete len:464 (-) comp26446_c0_seq1:267-1658(-)